MFIQCQKLQKEISNAYTYHREYVELHHQHLTTKPFHSLIKHSVPYFYTWTTHFGVAHAEWKKLRKKEKKHQQKLNQIYASTTSTTRRIQSNTTSTRNTTHANRTDISITGKERPPHQQSILPFVH